MEEDNLQVDGGIFPSLIRPGTVFYVDLENYIKRTSQHLEGGAGREVGVEGVGAE